VDITVYLPDGIGKRAKDAGLPFSRLLRDAVTTQLDYRDTLADATGGMTPHKSTRPTGTAPVRLQFTGRQIASDGETAVYQTDTGTIVVTDSESYSVHDNAEAFGAWLQDLVPRPQARRRRTRARRRRRNARTPGSDPPVTGTELTVPALRGLSLREVWDLEDKLDDAKALVSDYIDSEIRRLAGEGWTQTRIAEECGRAQSTVSVRMSRLEIAPVSSRGRPRIIAPDNSEPRYPEVVQFGVPAEIQETMAASLDAMPEPEREESLAKIRGEHGSWERKDAMAALAGLPPMPRPDQAPPPGSEDAIDDLVSAWDEIGAAIRDAREQDRAARGDYALTDSQLFRLDTARERVQEETAIDARPATSEIGSLRSVKSEEANR
jgi:hypothetical protein